MTVPLTKVSPLPKLTVGLAFPLLLNVSPASVAS